MKIEYFDALAGAGKTRALAHYAHKLARAGEKVVFVQPSKMLIDKTISDEIHPLRPKHGVKAIHGETSADVVRNIVQHFTAAEVGVGEILFITHEAYMRLPFIQNRKYWTLIFDETPSVDLFEALNVPESHRIITDLLDLREHEAAYAKIVPGEGCRVDLNQIARNIRGDQVWSQFSGLTSRIVSQDWDVFALQSNYHNLLRCDDRAKQLMTYSLLKPSSFLGFKQVIIAAALFKDSCLFQLWTEEGVIFEPVNAALHDWLRYQQHKNGELITINYVTDMAWSKTLRDRTNSADGKGCLRERLPSLIAEAMGEKSFAWMGNKDLPDDYFNTDRAVRLPNSPHGLNSYQHIHDVVILSALNAPPAHFQFMETRGLDADALRCAHYRTAVYQAVMRISIRNPLDTAPKSITVMDRDTAVWLAELFPGALVNAPCGEDLTVSQGKPGRPRRFATAADRVRACRERKRIAVASIEAINSSGSIPTYGTAFKTIYDADQGLELDLEDDNDFIQLLRKLHSRTIPSKHENLLFSPSKFDHSDPEVKTRRGKENVRYARGIWLDNDGGDLSYEEFARLFPNVRMVVWNTHSSTQNRPRWRCFIPMTCAVNVDVYGSLIGQIEHTLLRAGYASSQEIKKHSSSKLKNHGFDTGKFVASSLFYAPCQAASSDGSFFHDYNEETRFPIDPYQWVETDRRPLDVECYSTVVPAIARDVPDSGSVATAISRWRQTPRGQGHAAFFRLAMDLQRLGLSAAEIRQHMLMEAKHARSPLQRRAEVRSIVEGLRIRAQVAA